MFFRRQSARLAVLLVLLGIALHARSLGWGFLYDDFMHQSRLRYGERFAELSPWNLYDYGTCSRPGDSLYRSGLHPWWTDPDFRVRFLRPVASLSLRLDYRLYGSWAPGYHFTNLALFGVLLALAFRLFRDVGVPPRAALWALAFLACEDVLAIPVGWIANRNAILSSIFTVGAVLAVHRYRRGGCRTVLALGVASFLLACGSKESGLIGLPLIGFYLLVCEAPEGESVARGLIRVMRSAVPWLFAAAAAAYLAAYAAGGYGTNSRLYTTVWGEPLTYLKRLTVLAPVALTGLFFGVPADLVFARPAAALRVLAIGLPALLLAALFCVRFLRGSRPALFAAVWALLALVPVAGVTTGDRLLVNACIGTSMLLGLLLDRLGGIPGSIKERRYGSLAVVAFFVLAGIVLSAPMIRLRGGLFHKLAARDREAIANTEIQSPAREHRSAFLLNVPGAFFALTFLPTWTMMHDDPSAAVGYLQMGRRPLTLRRENERSLVIEYGGSGLLSNRYEMLFRTTPEPPAPGTVFESAEFNATVMETGPEGIRSARLDFKRALEDASYVFLAWRNGRMRRVEMPGPGETLELGAAIPVVPYAP